MKTVYCISGMGADERVFTNLDLPGYNIRCIKWLIPYKSETISAYALRLASHIDEDKPLLLGLSFGGMMCIEIAKLIDVEKIILISSVKSRDELPRWMRIAAKLKLNKILPLRSSRFTEPLQNHTLGVESEFEKLLARDYRMRIDPVFKNWAINQILNWKNNDCPSNVIHIHGSNDRIFPVKKLKPDVIISNGGHFMIINKANEINSKIIEILERV